MELIKAAVTLLLCSLIHNTGSVPVWDGLANYRQGATLNDQQDVMSTLQRNEDPPCELIGEPLNPAPPPPKSVNEPKQEPRPPPPNIFYQHMLPYYVLQYPGRRGSYAYGQHATYPKYIQAGGQLLPHSGYGGSGYLPVSQYRPLPAVPQSNPKGDQRPPPPAQRVQSSSSESSSNSDGD
ncbi:uncharacterized protein LOC134864341 [Eleginops maclovinus]|uniref:uncharacterized protein LOC134864341 n=1 Tax=Eleginops maclovinus TaxID=56733 RepID=UPI003080DFBF